MHHALLFGKYFTFMDEHDHLKETGLYNNSGSSIPLKKMVFFVPLYYELTKEG